MNWETIVTSRTAAEVAIQECAGNLEQIRSALDKGVTLGAARVIIKGIWGETPEAKKLVAQLSASFPAENSSIIRYAGLPGYALDNIAGPTKPGITFMLDTQHYIENYIGVILKQLSHFDPNNEVALNAHNEFRRNVLIYIEGIRWNSFTLSVEEAAEASAWKDYKVESQLVEDGDYLFITDFLPDLKEAHHKVVERRNREPEEGSDNPSLAGVQYSTKSYLAEINFTYLFAEYLTQLASTLEVIAE
jgi:hypothetical protein